MYLNMFFNNNKSKTKRKEFSSPSFIDKYNNNKICCASGYQNQHVFLFFFREIPIDIEHHHGQQQQYFISKNALD